MLMGWGRMERRRAHVRDESIIHAPEQRVLLLAIGLGMSPFKRGSYGCFRADLRLQQDSRTRLGFGGATPGREIVHGWKGHYN